MKEAIRVFADAFSTLGEAIQINTFVKLLKQIRPEHLIKAYILSAIFTVYSIVTKNGFSPILLTATAVLYPFSYIWIETISVVLPMDW